jgi:hypothetical protein
MKEGGIGATDHRGDPAGHVHYELYLLAALAIIAVAIGFPFATKHGFGGAALATLLIFVGVIACVAAFFWALGLLGLAHERWQERRWYLGLLAAGRLALVFALVSIVGAGVAGAVALGLDLSPPGSERLISILAPAAGILGVLARVWFPEAFWSVFGQFCLCLGLAVAGAFTGVMVEAILESPLSGIELALGTLVPPVAYVGWALWRWRSRATGAREAPSTDQTEEGKR